MRRCENALRIGRILSNLTRNRRGVTLFDEVAISNDISAACAGAVAPRPKATVETRLIHLAELKTKGLIDDEEYSSRRREILQDI